MLKKEYVEKILKYVDSICIVEGDIDTSSFANTNMITVTNDYDIIISTKTCTGAVIEYLLKECNGSLLWYSTKNINEFLIDLEHYTLRLKITCTAV